MKQSTFKHSLLLIGIFSLIVYSIYIYRPFYDKRLKIATTNMTMNNSFYVALNTEIKKEVLNKGDTFYSRNPLLDVNKQVEEINDFIDLNVNVIIINPVDGYNSQLIKALKKAKGSGIKIIVVDSGLKEDSFVDCMILSHNYKAGVLCAKDLMSKVSEAKILLIEHSQAISAVERIRGFLDTIKDNNQYKIVKSIDGMGQTEKVMPLVYELIKNKIQFDTIMSLNDPSSLGALAAIEEGSYNKNINLLSIDGSPNMKKIILDNPSYNYITAGQSPIKMGKKAVDNAYKLIKNKKVDKKIIINVNIISKDNIASYDISGWQ